MRGRGAVDVAQVPPRGSLCVYASEVSRRFFPGVLAACVAAVVGVASAPSPASAGLLSEFGKINYEASELTSKKANVGYERGLSEKVAVYKKSEAEKVKAEKQIEKLDKARIFSDAARSKARANQIIELEKKASKLGATDGKAAEEASQEAGDLKAKQKFEDTRAARQKEIREQVFKNLERQRIEAKKAAEDSEAIAVRIEKLAMDARAAANLARELADMTQ